MADLLKTGEVGDVVRRRMIFAIEAEGRFEEVVKKNFPIGAAVTIHQSREGQWEYLPARIKHYVFPLTHGVVVECNDPRMPSFRRTMNSDNLYQVEWSCVDLRSEVEPDTASA